MLAEAAEAARVVATQLERNAGLMQSLGMQLRERPPRSVVTCARGSSDHAATYARYLLETRLAVLTSSLAPSLASVYGAPLKLERSLFFAISLSGRSPDLIAAARAARAGGAEVLALVNIMDSPLEACADLVLPLYAGLEASVAATKSYIASLAALLQLAAHWSRHDDLLAALRRLPDDLERAWRLDWSAALPVLRDATSCFVIGRGLGLGVAMECALKLKETCGLHAEALSAAEVRHGPMALIRPGFPVLILAQSDETSSGVTALARELADRRAHVLLAGGTAPGATVLPRVRAPAVIEPLLFAQTFYRLAHDVALARGRDPDRPPHLTKVTETL
jgi:glucosamine--fructose-6-phosphate aminotransferase (isomerizing)